MCGCLIFYRMYNKHLKIKLKKGVLANDCVWLKMCAILIN